MACSLHPLKSLASQTQGQTNKEGGKRQLKEAEDTEKTRDKRMRKKLRVNRDGWVSSELRAQKQNAM